MLHDVFPWLLSLQELDKKFSETAQFVNMKKMLTSKNDQIKKLRAKLEQ